MRTLALILASLIVCGTGFAQQTVAFGDFSNNNTSAASAANGPAARASTFDFGAVSKVSIHSLLAPNSNARIYAHLMPWFGTNSHINVGYDSAKSDQVNRQIEDMVSRGIDGVIIYWTGASGSGDSARNNTAAMEIMKAAEQQQGFQFAIQEDKQALKECAATGCDVGVKRQIGEEFGGKPGAFKPDVEVGDTAAEQRMHENLCAFDRCSFDRHDPVLKRQI